MFKYTRHNLKKLEDLLAALDYTVRYEKGNFQSGYCMVEDRNIAIINKFYDTEGRINCLLNMLSNIQVDVTTLEEKQAKLYEQMIADWEQEQ